MNLFISIPCRIQDLAGNVVYEVPVEFHYLGAPGMTEEDCCKAASKEMIHKLHEALAQTALGSYILVNRHAHVIEMAEPYCAPLDS